MPGPKPSMRAVSYGTFAIAVSSIGCISCCSNLHHSVRRAPQAIGRISCAFQLQHPTF